MRDKQSNDTYAFFTILLFNIKGDNRSISAVTYAKYEMGMGNPNDVLAQYASCKLKKKK